MRSVVNGKQLWFVAVKMFLEDTKGRLLIIKDKFGNWDLPGGRMLPSEFRTPLERVVARKMREEVGRSVRYELGVPVVFFRHQRFERVTTYTSERVRIFAIGYRAKYQGGVVRLGTYITEHQWVTLKGFRPAQYLAGGWLEGVREYLRWRRKNN